MPDAQSILAPLQIPKNVKADAFDAYQGAKSADDLATRLGKLPLSQSVKADLWDAKNAEGGAVAPAAPPAAGGFWNGVGNFLGGVAETVNPLPAVQRYAIQPALDVAKSIHDGDGAGLLGAVQRLNPAGAIASDVMNAQVGQGQQAIDQAKQGNYAEAAGHAGAALLPVLGPAAAQAGETIGSGETARGLGQATGLIGGVLLPHAVGPRLADAGAAVATRAGDLATNTLNRVVDSAPRPLSPDATALAGRLNVPLTRGMQGGSKTIQAAEKMLGHSVAPDLYEPLLEQARQGVTAGAGDITSGSSPSTSSAPAANHARLRCTFTGGAGSMKTWRKLNTATLRARGSGSRQCAHGPGGYEGEPVHGRGRLSVSRICNPSRCPLTCGPSSRPLHHSLTKSKKADDSCTTQHGSRAFCPPKHSDSAGRAAGIGRRKLISAT